MKKIRIMLMSLAVVFAIGSALYSNALGINDARGAQTIGGACVIGNLVGPSNCNTTPNISRCQVDIPAVGGGVERVGAYSLGGTCQPGQELFRP